MILGSVPREVKWVIRDSGWASFITILRIIESIHSSTTLYNVNTTENKCTECKEHSLCRVEHQTLTLAYTKAAVWTVLKLLSTENMIKETHGIVVECWRSNPARARPKHWWKIVSQRYRHSCSQIKQPTIISNMGFFIEWPNWHPVGMNMNYTCWRNRYIKRRIVTNQGRSYILIQFAKSLSTTNVINATGENAMSIWDR